MQFKSVCLGLSFGDAEPTPVEASPAAENYAISFCGREKAHLSVVMASPAFHFPLAHAFADQINAERRARAEEAQKRIASAAAIAGVAVDFEIVQHSHAVTNERVGAAARPSDIVIVARPTDGLSLDGTLIEAMLFTSGRPVIAVPPLWERGAAFENIMVAWDGSARAARAVGDAMPLLTRAGRIEILCVSPDASKSVAGADLATHLARHCGQVAIVELQTQQGDVAKTLRAHAAEAGADLFVMGAYVHPHLLQMALGGVTSDMLSEADFPLLLSH